MNRMIIYQYINRLKKEDIIKFINYKGLFVSDDEIETIYYYIKNEYKRFFNNPIEVLEEIKMKVSNYTYNEIINLYEKYKTKIS